jgi:DNA-binding FadR family transcriptional regulator
VRPKLSDVLEAELTRDIREGIFGPDGRLPSENALSRRFGVSRPIVREALRRLRDGGLIHSRQGAGSFVLETEQADDSLAAAPLAQQPPPIHSIADIRKVYEYRIAIEGEIAAVAAQNANDAKIAAIGDQLAMIQSAIDSGHVGVDQDNAFHMAIAEATDNHLLLGALQLVQPHLNFVIDLARSFSILGTPPHVAMVQNEHSAIFEAIARHDPQGARAAMHRHIVAARDRVFFGVHSADTTIRAADTTIPAAGPAPR